MSIRPISAGNLQEMLAKEEVTVLDLRPADQFLEGFIPGSISIGAENRFNDWLAGFLEAGEQVVLVTLPGKEQEAVQVLQEAGIRLIAGWLEGGFDSWLAAGLPIDLLISVEADELAMDLPHDPHLVVVDVREPLQYAEGHVSGAQNLPLAELTDIAAIANFEENQNLYIHCGGGHKSCLAASLFKRQGIHNLRVVQGGFAAIRAEKSIQVEKEPSQLN